jgi:hypothetical protein
MKLNIKYLKCNFNLLSIKKFMANNKLTAHSFQNKKQVKKELAHNIEIALPEIKLKLGEKKFNKRIKKAAKLITEGLHLKSHNKKDNNPEKTELTEIPKAPVKENSKKSKAV